MHSSHELASSYAIDFVISLYLILLIGIQTFDVTITKLKQIRQRVCIALTTCYEPVGLQAIPNLVYILDGTHKQLTLNTSITSIH